jgi:hypothetical protein
LADEVFVSVKVGLGSEVRIVEESGVVDVDVIGGNGVVDEAEAAHVPGTGVDG